MEILFISRVTSWSVFQNPVTNSESTMPLQGRRKQFYIGQAKYKQHVRHLNAKVALEHASQENSVIL